MGRAIPLLIVAACAWTQALAQPAPEAPGVRTDKAPVRAQRFMAVTANPHATDAAQAILARGGSAVDAAIAAQLVLGLVEPQSSGIGGGAFMLVHDARRSRLHAYDGRETAPAAASAGRFLKPDGTPMAFRDAVATGIAVGVPGLVRMLGLAHAKHGRLAWAELFAPAIALAEGGFRVSPRLATLIAVDRQLKGDARASAYFHDAEGRPLAAGTLLRNPTYATTLRTLAREGADAFYRGPIADDIVATVRGHAVHPGDLTHADLASYRAIEREPVCGVYRRHRVCGASAGHRYSMRLTISSAVLECTNRANRLTFSPIEHRWSGSTTMPQCRSPCSRYRWCSRAKSPTLNV